MQNLIAKVAGAEATGIKKVGIIGAGAMGAGIAAQFADAGIAVELLDIARGDNRIEPAETGISRQLKLGGFTTPDAAARVRPGNIDDHLARLQDADWVIEAVVEKLDVKRALFRKIAPCLKPSAILSSNTSTIPRHDLVAGMESSLARRFAITHFFNPPRLMPLLEVVVDDQADPELRDRLHQAARILLSKTPIDCHDTPGFIANRIGCFWIAVSVTEACRFGLDIETADAVQTVLGVPKTGVFGLLDLIGIDLVPTIWGGLMQALPTDDALQIYNLPGNPLITELLAKGSFGRKAGGGFYRKTADGQFEVLDTDKLLYRAPRPVQLSRELQELLSEQGPVGNYARSVLRKLISYCETHLSEIASDASAIDTAMQLGYSWREGPFVLAAKAVEIIEC
ncbi:3-hydroxyacyl-CoA dehydrogenase [Ochrobactrum sp. MYb15]|uniref:3-hydroxyacyl-CoA dehydrogenase family protein n=1 Tax=Brucella pituitosa TaxID=571256 RepID=UPI000CFD70A4|nr:3-hydroxyacyl-CoA dehydrogenase [Ochrobactrum sp. MYb19]PRA60246.1 3-hydroxyacyl-CoA dehydrogenase [Ochrobactrum sp. MYb18]PRA73562.1 3-hydroxyacyl-CoA dehydrogenase [Brucella thiophenivorans]PRA84458.1 3-hydroxyacyl-CoA dehydrogenase [Ochrobactrum sp. MYb14]PRA94618.1 3-hydroxyacyl-CoA dehydrogenase [Ochrobactrum sp. MYb15]